MSFMENELIVSATLAMPFFISNFSFLTRDHQELSPNYVK
jgi:hypothetical protein